MQSDAFGRGPPPPPPPGEQGLEKIRREILSELAVPRVSGAGSRGGLKGAGGGAGVDGGSDEGRAVRPDRPFIHSFIT